MRKLYIVGEITEETFGEFSEQLADLEQASKQKVQLELHSAGGDLETAIALWARIRSSPCDIEITLYGTASSSAVLVLAAGDKRRMHQEAWVMLHKTHDKLNDSVDELELGVKRIKQLDRQYYRLLSSVSILTSIEWKELHSKTTYLDAASCLIRGLADEVFE